LLDSRKNYYQCRQRKMLSAFSQFKNVASKEKKNYAKIHHELEALNLEDLDWLENLNKQLNRIKLIKKANQILKQKNENFQEK